MKEEDLLRIHDEALKQRGTTAALDIAQARGQPNSLTLIRNSTRGEIAIQLSYTEDPGDTRTKIPRTLRWGPHQRGNRRKQEEPLLQTQGQAEADSLAEDDLLNTLRAFLHAPEIHDLDEWAHQRTQGERS